MNYKHAACVSDDAARDIEVQIKNLSARTVVERTKYYEESSKNSRSVVMLK